MKDGFRIIDSDLHIIEPPGLCEKYIDGAYKDRAPKIVGHYPIGTYGLMEGHMLPTVDAHARERWNGMFRLSFWILTRGCPNQGVRRKR